MRKITSMFLLALTCLEANAINIPFDEKGSMLVGSGINMDFPFNSMSHCVTGEKKWDSTGATETNASIKLVTSYKSLAKALDVDLSYSIKAETKISLASLSVETAFSKKFSEFRKNEEHTLALIISANAKYGRKMLHNIKLKNTHMALINEGKFEDFKRQCGTHFISGEKRKSQLDVVIMISGLNSHSKSRLENNFKVNLGGSYMGSKVDVKSKSKYIEFLEASKRQGNLDIKYFSRGGSGLDHAVFAQQVNAGTFQQLTKTVADISKSFTQENSAPSEYILVPYDVFGVPPVKYDQDRHEKIALAYEKLIKINSDINKMDSYRTDYDELYSKIYKTKNKTLKKSRENLINFINDCNLYNKCDNYNPEDIRYEISFLEDVFLNYDFNIECHYRPYVDRIESLDVISFNLLARTELVEYLQLDNVEIYRINSDLIKEDITDNSQGFSVSECRKKNESENCVSRLFGTIDSLPDLTDYTVTVKSRADNINIDAGKLVDLRTQFQKNSYMLSTFLKDGSRHNIDIGSPSIKDDCPAFRDI